MAIKILMPALSPTMTEGSLTKWLVKVGDKVKAGDILAEIETDKATMEIEAVDEGEITNLLVKEGSTEVPINSTLAILNGDKNDIIDNEESNIEKDKNIDLKIKNKEDNLIEHKDFNIKENIEEDKENQRSDKSITLENKKLISSPLVRNLANTKNIDLKNIKGSGPNGRIIKRDLNQINNGSKIISNNNFTNPSSIRKIIAEKTTLTKQTVPHFYLTIESNVDSLLEMRKEINKNLDSKISINDILVKALAQAQKNNPLSNVSWIDGKIIKHDTVDVSIAVALDEGLITPILKNADKKGLKEISKEIKYLVNKSKNGNLLVEEYNGGTISISNLGMFGISEFSAIINPPQSSILAVGTIKKTPYVVSDEIKVVSVLKSTLSADHRVLDGAVAGKLLKDFHDIIENPYNLWLISNDMEVI